MSNQDNKKQHKRGFMYIYKGGGIGNQRKKELETAVVEQEKKSSSRSWLQRIRNSTRTLNVENGGHSNREMDNIGGFVEARKSTSCLELESKGGFFVEGRKSVSCIEGSILSSPAAAAARGIIVEEGRKSVSHIEKGRGGIVEARKSVSQIETLSSVAAYLQVKVLVSDMPSFMQVHAFRCAKRTYDSLEKFSSKHIALNIKKVCIVLCML